MIDQVLNEIKLVYSTTNFLNLPLVDALRKIAEAGFSNVEIWGNLKHLDPRNEDESTEDVRAVAQELGLNVVSIHAPFTVPFGGTDDERTAKWESLVMQSIDDALCLGAEQIVVHPFTSGRDESDEAYRRLTGRSKAALSRIALVAGKKGLRVAVENMPAHRLRKFGRDIGELYDFTAESGLDNLGICMDTGHVIFNNGDVVEDLRRYSERIFSLHMNDNIWGMHMDLHLVPGTGSIDWPAFRKTMLELSYCGMIVLELDGRGRPTSIIDEAGKFAEKFFSETDGEDK